MGNNKRKQCRFQNTCLRVETNYRTVTGDQKAFGWTEDKVIFIDHEIFFYRENFGLLELLGLQPRNNKKSLSDVHACHYVLERARSYPKTWYDGTQSIIVSQVNRFVSDLLSYNMTTWIAFPVLKKKNLRL